MHRAARSFLPLASALLLFAGCLQTESGPGDEGDDAVAPDDWSAPAQPTLDAATVLASLQAFSEAYPQRHDNLPTHEGARQAIAQQFAAAGLTVWRHDFDGSGLPQANIVGVKWGVDRDNWVVVGAHYDTTHDDCIVAGFAGSAECPAHAAASTGAYDDGSGTILVVELGKLWANVSNYYTIAFVAYDGEERGLEGAKAFVEAATTGPLGPFGNVTLRGALDIDMFGITWPGTDTPTQILDNSAALHAVFHEARTAIGMPDDMYYCGDLRELGSSDFQEYFDREIPVVFFSSDFGKWTPPGSPVSSPQAVYPNWHLADTYATMEANAGGATPLLQGFETASTLAAAELHALADTQLDLDVHEPVTGAC